MHGKISALRTKSYFHDFPIINCDTALKTHMGRQKIQPSPKQLPGAMAGSEVGQISFWRKEKVLTNAPGCLAAGADTLTAHGGATQACGSTCSSSPSPFPLEPFRVIYGALTTVVWCCCRSRACFPLGEPTVPAGECRRRDGMPALHSFQRIHTDQWEATGAQQPRTTEMEKQHKGAFL